MVSDKDGGDGSAVPSPADRGRPRPGYR